MFRFTRAYEVCDFLSSCTQVPATKESCEKILSKAGLRDCLVGSEKVFTMQYPVPCSLFVHYSLLYLPIGTGAVLFNLKVFMKFYHPDQLAEKLERALKASLFVQNVCRKLIARVRFRRLKALAKAQSATVVSLLLDIEVCT
jgi:hypothetical protein